MPTNDNNRNNSENITWQNEPKNTETDIVQQSAETQTNAPNEQVVQTQDNTPTETHETIDGSSNIFNGRNCPKCGKLDLIIHQIGDKIKYTCTCGHYFYTNNNNNIILNTYLVERKLLANSIKKLSNKFSFPTKCDKCAKNCTEDIMKNNFIQKIDLSNGYRYYCKKKKEYLDALEDSKTCLNEFDRLININTDVASEDPIFQFLYIKYCTNDFTLWNEDVENQVSKYESQAKSLAKVAYSNANGNITSYDKRIYNSYLKRLKELKEKYAEQLKTDKDNENKKIEKRKKIVKKALTITSIILCFILVASLAVGMCFKFKPEMFYGSTTITYSVNGQDYHVKAVYSKDFEINVPTKFGYTFLGLYDAEEDGNQIVDKNGQSIGKWSKKGKNNKITYFALFAPQKFTIKYDTGDKELKILPTEVEYEGEMSDILETNRTGYTLEHWVNAANEEEIITDSDGKILETKKIFNSSEYTIHDFETEIKLKAVWTANTYKITYDADGGTVSRTSQDITYNNNTNLITATKSGYDFVGWFDENEKQVTNEVGKLSDNAWKYDKDMTLVAKYELTKYKATFMSYDNTEVDTIEFTIEDINKNELSSIPNLPTRKGYTGKWNTYTLSQNDITINATWSPNKYSVTFDSAGGDFNSTSLEIYYDSTINLGIPNKSGQSFTGWSYNGVLLTDSTGKLLEPWSYDEPITLVALYDTTTYTATFKADGKEVGTISFTSDTRVLSNIPQAPAKTGYSFTGWYYDNTLIIDSDYNPINWNYAKNLTLTARYQINTYTAFFEVDGQVIAKVTFTINDSVLSNIPQVPAKEYHTGVWENYTLKAEDITIRAIYTKDSGDTTSFAGGHGTIESPYEISSASQLYNISNSLDSHYILINDINVSGFTNWEPIGGAYKENVFTGTLDGNNYSIIGLTRTSTIAAKNNRLYFGLFGYIGSDAVVKNIIFKDININLGGPKEDNNNYKLFYGVLAGRCDGKISNVVIESGTFNYDSDDDGASYIGGVAGVSNDATFENCINKVNISNLRGSAISGGIVATSVNTQFTECENYGDIYSRGTWVSCWVISGGIVGEYYKPTPSIFNNCKNEGKITAYSGAWFSNKYSNEIFGFETNTKPD